MTVNVIPATPELIQKAMGPSHRSVRAVAFERAGEVLGCAGLLVDDTRLVLFGQFSDEVRKHPRALVIAYRQLLELADRRALPLHAKPDPAIPASERFLTHIGFRPIAPDVWERLPKGRT